MKKVIFVAFCVQFSFLSFAQKSKNVAASYQLKVENGISIEAAQQKACDFARVEAMEAEFGRVVIQGNSTYIENIETGKKVESKSVFNMTADTYVNAEWLEDTQKPKLEKFLNKDDIWVKCSVEGKAIEIKNAPIDILAETMDCPKISCKTTDFQNEESMFLLFKSPKDGFVSVFLDDRTTSFCIYPYQNMSYEQFVNQKFMAQKEYYFFDKSNPFLSNKSIIDELNLTTEKTQESNRVFVVFSENALVIPVLYDKKQNADLSFIPRSIPSEKFQKWLQNIRIKDKTAQVKIVDVTIKK